MTSLPLLSAKQNHSESRSAFEHLFAVAAFCSLFWKMAQRVCQTCVIKWWSYRRCRAPSTLWCQTHFLTPRSPYPSSSSPSLPSSSGIHQAGRRGRTHQLVMYSQYREKWEGRLSNVWNTPVEFSGGCFCTLVESFMKHWNRFLLTSAQLTPLFFPSTQLCMLLFLLLQLHCWESYGENVLSWSL